MLPFLQLSHQAVDCWLLIRSVYVYACACVWLCVCVCVCVCVCLCVCVCVCVCVFPTVICSVSSAVGAFAKQHQKLIRGIQNNKQKLENPQMRFLTLSNSLFVLGNVHMCKQSWYSVQVGKHACMCALCACMRVCMCACVYVDMYLCNYAYVCICACSYICLLIYMYIYIYT